MSETQAVQSDRGYNFGPVYANGQSSLHLGDVVNHVQHITNVFASDQSGEYGQKPRQQKPDVLALLRYENMHAKRDFSMPIKAFNHDWIWSTSFDKWLREESDRSFWICGKPASGKSTLIAYLAHSQHTLSLLRSQDDTFQILYFFYDYRAGSGLANTVTGMLRMFLYQLAHKFDAIKRRLEMLIQNEELDPSSFESLLHNTCEALNNSNLRVCAFIDGLDEYEGNYVELLQICNIILERTSLKLCVASRPEAEVSKVLRILPEIFMQDHNRASMQAYYTGKVAQLTVDNIDAPKMFNDSVCNKLIARAEGVILWFRLAWDETTRAFLPDWTEEQLWAFVDALPLGLEAMYHRILFSIPLLHRQEAAITLHIVNEFRELTRCGFKSTDAEHLWGTYHFLADMADVPLGLIRLDECTSFVTRIKTLLRGLIEFYDVEQDRLDIDLGASELDTRLIHKTFSAYLFKFPWVSDNLPDTFVTRFPDSFCCRLFCALISAAATDEILSKDHLRRIDQELRIIAPVLDSAFNGDMTQLLLTVAKDVLYTFSRAGLLGLAVLKEFWPRLLTITYEDPTDDNIDKIKHFLYKAGTRSFFSLRRPFAFPPKWRLRRELLRTAFQATLYLAQDFEPSANLPNVLAPALTSNLNILFCVLTKKEGALNDYIAVSMAGDPDLRGIADIVMATATGLIDYCFQMCHARHLTRKQLDFCLSTALIQGPFDLPTTTEFVAFWTSQGAHVNAVHICELLQFTAVTTCRYGSVTYSGGARSISDIIPLIAACVEQQNGLQQEPGHCRICQNPDQKGSLLSDWIQYHAGNGLGKGELGKNSRRSVYHDCLTALRLVLACGVNLRLPCYKGGDVLQGLLRPATRKAWRRGYFRARFTALVDCGFRPSSSAHVYLTLAKKSYRKASQYGKNEADKQETRITMDGIVAALNHYLAHDAWPSVEELSGDAFWIQHSSRPFQEDLSGGRDENFRHLHTTTYRRHDEEEV